MFGKKKQEIRNFDRENCRPVIRASICTGEQTAGFKNIHTGRFEEVMLIRNHGDLERFLALYQIEADEVKKEY